ncbi:MAG: dihydrofolate reductase family protein [Solirubrobacteraceae bacterium]
MEAPLYRRLVPEGAATDARSYLQSLELNRRQPDRPYVLANFVASVDGHTTVGEQSRKLSGPADREMFYALRERVDAVLVGANTLVAEQYKRMLPQTERRERRLAAGRPAEPLAVTVTRSGNVRRDIPLFAETPENVLVFERVELPEVLHTLRDEHGITSLLCEGGPTLFGALLDQGLVDELFLTLAPSLVGGASGPAVVSGPPPEAPAELELESALECDGTLFLRYRVQSA